MPRASLTPDARATIERTLPVAAYVRQTWPDGVWRGDKCGCTDDRCIGYHHDDREDCDCLSALLADVAEAEG